VPEVDRGDATSKRPSSKLRADATQLSGLAAPSNNRAENKSSGFLLELPRPFSVVGKYRMQQSFSPRTVGGQDTSGFLTLETLGRRKQSLSESGAGPQG
jgi:hypothetical protein